MTLRKEMWKKRSIRSFATLVLLSVILFVGAGCQSLQPPRYYPPPQTVEQKNDPNIEAVLECFAWLLNIAGPVIVSETR